MPLQKLVRSTCTFRKKSFLRGVLTQNSIRRREIWRIQNRMTNALGTGEIEMVSTDHAPHTNVEKQRGWDDIFRAPSGTPGVETRLPLLLNLVHQDRLILSDIPRITSSSAAKRFGTLPEKGDPASWFGRRHCYHRVQSAVGH